MHWFFAKLSNKKDGGQIEEAIDKSFESKFCLAIFSGLMHDYFFSNFIESCPLGDHGYVSMHFTINRYILNNFFTVDFQFKDL